MFSCSSSIILPIERSDRFIPLVRIDADEVVLLALLQESHALAHQRVADDRPRLGAVIYASGVESCDQCADVVAVDALGMPAKRAEFAVDRLARQHVPRRTVGLLIVDVDNG